MNEVELNDQKRLRKRLDPLKYLDILDDIDELLAEQWQFLGKNQIDSLKLRAEVQFRRLQKSLPDLKAVEMVAEPDSPVRFIFSDGAKTVDKDKKTTIRITSD